MSHRLSFIDMAIFEQLTDTNNKQCTFGVNECISIQRLIMALRYYQIQSNDTRNDYNDKQTRYEWDIGSKVSIFSHSKINGLMVKSVIFTLNQSHIKNGCLLNMHKTKLRKYQD